MDMKVGGGNRGQHTDRQKRLAEALRANLKRRKEQRREPPKSAPEPVDSVNEAET